MTKIVSVLILVGAVSLLGGCAKREPRKPNGRLAPAQPDKALAETRDFSWGGGVIRCGMPKAEVVEQIRKSGLREWNGAYGIEMPDEKTQASDDWRIGFGNGSGAAPGGGRLQIVFKDGNVVRIVPAEVCA